MRQPLQNELIGAIECVLIESGVPASAAVAARVAGAVDSHVIEMASDSLALVLTQLGTSTMATAIKRRLLHDNTPLRDAAAEIGCSAAALCKAEQKLARALGAEPEPTRENG